ncbi:MAG: DUF4238 domain-containing protein [Gammaproteobacteria bacterium]
MKSYKNQHYVPRFLLRRFSEDRSSIRLFNIGREIFVDAASIASQCAKNNFYSQDINIELALKEIDTDAAGIIEKICRTKVIPSIGESDRLILTFFTVLQKYRTQSAADDMDDINDKMIKHIYGRKIKKELRLTDEDLAGIKIGINLASARATAMAAEAYVLALDLDVKMLINQTNQEFIISDNPVIFYNQYLEHRTIVSNTGLQSQGLEILFPLDKQSLLLFYDPAVYRVGSNKQNHIVSLMNVNDVAAINKASYLNAINNIYFRSKAMNSVISQLHGKYKIMRNSERTNLAVISREETGNGYSETIKMSGEDLRIGLRPSVISIRKSASQRLRKMEMAKWQPALLMRNPEIVKNTVNFMS